MLGQVVAAQFDLEVAITELSRVGMHSAIAQAQGQLQSLIQVQRQIGSASLAGLAAMRGDIAAAVNQAAAITAEGRSANAAQHAEAALANVTANTRQTIANVSADLFERKVLDPYLQFDDTEDEAAYRKREEQRKAYIKAELAKGTPQGALNAADATKTQLEDARDHGAAASPDFARMYGTVTTVSDAQRKAMEAPIENQPKQPARADALVYTPSNDKPTDLDEIAAALRAAGVNAPNPATTPRNSHGLTETASTEPVKLGRTS